MYTEGYEALPRTEVAIDRDETTELLMSRLASDLSETLEWLSPEVDDVADCLETALEAASFFDDAGMARYLCFGVLSTNETNEPRATVVTPHYWLEIPLRDGKLFVDLTLPHWLTSPDCDETDRSIPTVLTDLESNRLGREYKGSVIPFPDLCGTDTSGHFMDHPLHLRFDAALIGRYERLAPVMQEH